MEEFKKIADLIMYSILQKVLSRFCFHVLSFLVELAML